MLYKLLILLNILNSIKCSVYLYTKFKENKKSLFINNL